MSKKRKQSDSIEKIQSFQNLFMSEEFFKRDLINNPEKIGKWDFYNIGATSVKNLKQFGIIRDVDYGKEEIKKVDGIIVEKKNVIAVVEYKKPSEFQTNAQKDKAIKQELEVAKKLGASIIVATDTKKTVWVNVFTDFFYNFFKFKKNITIIFLSRFYEKFIIDCQYNTSKTFANAKRLRPSHLRVSLQISLNISEPVA